MDTVESEKRLEIDERKMKACIDFQLKNPLGCDSYGDTCEGCPYNVSWVVEVAEESAARA